LEIKQLIFPLCHSRLGENKRSSNKVDYICHLLRSQKYFYNLYGENIGFPHIFYNRSDYNAFSSRENPFHIGQWAIGGVGKSHLIEM